MTLKREKIHSVLVLVVIYAPLFIKFFFGRENYGTIVYLCLFALLVPILSRKRLDKSWVRLAKPILLYNGIFILIVLFQWLLALSDARASLSLISANILSSLLIYYFWTLDDATTINTLERIFFAVNIIFLIQLGFSAYESYIGNPLASTAQWSDQSSSDIASGFTDRLLFTLVTSDIGILSNLKLPFSGLMGQTNYWGTQLPFYNLIFLYQYYLRGRKVSLLMLLLTVTAALFNTSRFGIIAIITTDLAFFFYIWRRRAFLMALVSAVAIGVFAFYSQSIIEAWRIYFERTDTLTLRSDIYQAWYDFFKSQDLAGILFGLGLTELDRLSYTLAGFGSFESEFVVKSLHSGLVGLFLFIWLLAKMAGKSISLRKDFSLFGLLLVFNIIMVSVISNLVFVDSIYSLVTLFYLYNILLATRDSIRSGI